MRTCMCSRKGEINADCIGGCIEFKHINHPQHYGGDTTYEAIKVIEAWRADFLIGNTLKYLSRAGKKEGSSELQDLEKAAWYLQRRIDNLKNNKP